MNEEQPLTRQELASRILNNAAAYKVCEICGSVVSCECVLCTNCQGYRFDDRPERVEEQAIQLAASRQRSITSDDLVS